MFPCFPKEAIGPRLARDLPGYAPELNPAEHNRGYWRHHERTNFCPRDFGALSHQVSRALRHMRRRRSVRDGRSLVI